MLRFFEENNVSLQLSDFDILYKGSSSKNKSIELLTHKVLGKILIINGEIQHIEAWAPIYHENLIHIPASFIPSIKRVLILGGGSLYAAMEVFKYKSIEKVVMVDHDEAVIQLMQKYYSHVQSILDNKNYELIFEDAYEFLIKNVEKFDLIVNDALDLLESENRLFDVLAGFLTPGGICSDVVYRHIFESEKSRRTITALRGKYNSAFSLITIPEYPGILHLLSMWSKTNSLKQNSGSTINESQKEWIKNRDTPCLYYDPRFISYYLHLPPYLKKWVNII